MKRLRSDVLPGVRRRLARVAALALLVPLAALVPTGAAHAADTANCGPGSTSDRDAVCTLTTTDATHMRIDQPFVAGPSYEYDRIVFQPGDEITIDAGGCVQTGGSGETWKRYLDPRGSGSGYPAGLYWGWVTIPGAYYADKPEQPVTHVPLGDIVFGKHTLKIAALGDPADFVQPLDLIVGYTDDEYGDNGYYNHDDGNDNQCSLDHDGGSAWLTLSVNHGTPGPMPALHPKPFDLVPTGYDSNLLFRDPVWGWQANGGTVGNEGNYVRQCYTGVPCTSQTTDEDRIGWDLFEIFGLCGGDPPTGHRNWFDVTYTGSIDFDEHAGGIGGDDDYNMALKPRDFKGTGPAGATAGNPDEVKLEFDSDETVDHFDHQPWWAEFHDAVDDDDRGRIDRMVKDHDAVVTGLMGIDQVHAPGGAEIHPVHTLAIRESAPGAINTANDAWVFMVRNSGNEGECGSQQHYLDAHSITVDVPRPPGVPANATASLVGNNEFLAHGTRSAPAVHNSKGGVQVTFTLPNGENKPWEVGELHLNWTGTGLAPAPTAAPAPKATAAQSPRLVAEEPGEENDPEARISKAFAALTPAQQALAKDMFAQLRPPKTVDDETSATAYVTGTAPAFPTSVPTVSHAPDPRGLARLHAQFQALCSASGGNLPGLDICPTLNQPPLTRLTTTGGTPGQNGWLVSPVTATLTAYDANGSGIDRTEYSYDGQTWLPYTGPFTLPDGDYTFSYRSKDKKGNLEEIRGKAFKIDTKAPATTAALVPPANGNGWIVADGTVTLHATDPVPGSGVASITYSTSGAQTTPPATVAGDSAALTITREGETVITFHATDKAGNAEPDRILTVRVDKTPAASRFTTADGTIFIAVDIGAPDTQFVTGTATDAAAGVDEVTVTFTPTLLGQPQSAKAAVTCTDATRHSCTWKVAPPRGIGTYKVTSTATDRAGNKETAGSGIHITVIRLLL
ncbi:OmpL47-type beta-barrel domain-containing protein [Streptomyces noboritoensis]|uniref:OmpL47-type beta-barrel domain-containing protein n=1 Tax=Streptomyces noboritoensis TaxID=67337 RepID=A0ABV6T982_9ACTN